MADTQTFVLVGGGLTAATTAATLREEGFDGRLVLVGEEPERPYERPPLSKGYLRGEDERSAAYVHDEGFYAEHDIDLRTGTRATALDPGASELELEGGERIRYDRLLLATGAAPRELDVPGGHLDGVHLLRTFADCDALRERLTEGARVVVVGGGWIGAEVAASARQKGLDVTMLLLEAAPLERVLGKELASFYADVHRAQGVQIMPRTGVATIQREGDGRRVRTSGGRALDCDFVVVGAGVTPRVELAEAAGLRIENGIAVDARLATSAPGVFAAGDVANAENTFLGRSIRVEHWENARVQGALAARTMLGKDAQNDAIPYFFSDQYDVGMEYSGYPERWDEVVIRGSLESRELIAFWLEGGRVVAGMNVNIWDVQDAIRALISSGAQVDRERLADPDVPLEELAPAAS